MFYASVLQFRSRVWFSFSFDFTLRLCTGCICHNFFNSELVLRLCDISTIFCVCVCSSSFTLVPLPRVRVRMSLVCVPNLSCRGLCGHSRVRITCISLGTLSADFICVCMTGLCDKYYYCVCVPNLSCRGLCDQFTFHPRVFNYLH